MSWHDSALRMAGQVTPPGSRWHAPVSAVPRHELVPAWWGRHPGGGWVRRDATEDPEGPWRNRSLVTQVGTMHADHALPGDRADGPPTSSSTKPGLVVNMYRHAMIGDGMDVLDVGTGSGYGCALLAARLGDRRVTSIDVDPYLAAAAIGRLRGTGLRPDVRIADAAIPLGGEWDRIVSMTSVAPVPASWLAALRPGGRIVTTIAGTGLLVTADRTPDGGAAGRVEWDRAAFMRSRSGPGYPPPLLDGCPQARDGDGDGLPIWGRYPVVDVEEAWELRSMLGVTLPGTECHYEEHDGKRTAWLLHPDGSWARAEASGGEDPVVSQGGPRRLWDHLDALREQWLADGGLPVYGSKVTIAPDGAITFSRGRWSATIPAEPAREPVTATAGARERS